MADDENCINLADNNLGEIRIQLDEILSYQVVPTPHVLTFIQAPGAVRIHEHPKKLMTHCTGYGDYIRREAAKRTASGIVTGKRLATFVFPYRALDILQAQGIAPPPPQQVFATQREKKRQRCKEEDIEVIDDGEADRVMLKILKAEISKIEAQLLKRQKTMIKSEDKARVITHSVIELE